MHVDHPFHIDRRGHTASTSETEHVRNLIEQFLFTAPGERVNRPTFGSGLLQLVFAPNSDALAAATQATIQASLQQWLGELIDVSEVRVDSEGSTLAVRVAYVVRRTQQAEVVDFAREV
jgi:uncharacterized protein